MVRCMPYIILPDKVTRSSALWRRLVEHCKCGQDEKHNYSLRLLKQDELAKIGGVNFCTRRLITHRYEGVK